MYTILTKPRFIYLLAYYFFLNQKTIELFFKVDVTILQLTGLSSRGHAVDTPGNATVMQDDKYYLLLC